MPRRSPHPLPRLPRRRDGLVACVALVVLGSLAIVWPDPAASPGPYSAPVVSHLTGPDLRLGAVGDVPVRIRPPWADASVDLAGHAVLYDRPSARPLPPVDTAWEPVTTRSDGAFMLAGPAAESAPDDGDTTVSLVERVRDARVSVVGDGATRACDRWLFDRWFCGPEPWLYVGATELSVRGRPWRCIWAHPTSEGALEIAFDGLPAGGSLRGRYAYADAAADRATGEGVTLEVVVDGESVTRVVAPIERGHGTWRANLPGDATVATLRVTSTELAQRHFCVDAAVRSEPVVGTPPPRPILPASPTEAEPSSADDASLRAGDSSPRAGGLPSLRPNRLRLPQRAGGSAPESPALESPALEGGAPEESTLQEAASDVSAPADAPGGTQ